MFFLFSLFLLTSGIYAQQTRQNLEEQRRQVLREIEVTNGLLRETVRGQEQSLAKLNLLNAQVEQYNRLITSINAEIAYTNRQISATTTQIIQMTNDIERMKTEYAILLNQAYKNRGQYNQLIYVLSAKDFNEAYRRMKYFQQYSDYRKKQVTEIQIKQVELNEAIELLNAQRAENEQLLVEQRNENAKLQAVKKELEEEANKFRARQRQLTAQLQEQQQRERRIQNEINRLIEGEVNRRSTPTTSFFDRLTPEERVTSNSFRANRGSLPWPTERGSITGKYGVTRHALLSNVEMPSSGITITTVANADVRAVFNGEVTEVGGVPGNNMFVIIQHGNYFTVYINLIDVSVKQKDRVSIRETIGKVYTERGAPSAELKFQVYDGATRQNPELWLSKL